MTLGSLTDCTKSYDIVLDQNGKPTRCTCLDFHYKSQRNPNHVCKHMDSASRMFEVEVEKAQAFLALKAQLEAQEREACETAAAYTRMFYSEF